MKHSLNFNRDMLTTRILDLFCQKKQKKTRILLRIDMIELSNKIPMRSVTSALILICICYACNNSRILFELLIKI